MNSNGLESEEAMTKLALQNDLPFITISIAYQGAELKIPHVLIDTGSATTILATDIVSPIGIVPLPEDILHTIRGVGGIEVVFERTLDYLQLGECHLSNFSVDVGGMDYGFDINGILGMDVLTRAGAIINLSEMEITFTARS